MKNLQNIIPRLTERNHPKQARRPASHPQTRLRRRDHSHLDRDVVDHLDLLDRTYLRCRRASSYRRRSWLWFMYYLRLKLVVG